MKYIRLYFGHTPIVSLFRHWKNYLLWFKVTEHRGTYVKRSLRQQFHKSWDSFKKISETWSLHWKVKILVEKLQVTFRSFLLFPSVALASSVFLFEGDFLLRPKTFDSRSAVCVGPPQTCNQFDLFLLSKHFDMAVKLSKSIAKAILPRNSISFFLQQYGSFYRTSILALASSESWARVCDVSEYHQSSFQI